MPRTRPEGPQLTPPEPVELEEIFEEDTFDAPAEGEGWDGSGGPPPGMEEEYAEGAPTLPPSKAKAAAKALRDQLQGTTDIPLPDSVTGKRTISVTAKRTYSTRDSSGTLDSRGYEVTVSEEREMSYAEARRVHQVLTNDATLLVATYLGQEVEEDENGRLVWAQMKPPTPSRQRAEEPATESRGNGGGTGRTRPTSNGGSYGDRGGDSSANYTREQATAMWEDWCYEGNEREYWENWFIFGDKTKSQYAEHPSIRPKTQDTLDRIKGQVGQMNQGPMQPKPLYVRFAPPGVQAEIKKLGVPIR